MDAKNQEMMPSTRIGAIILALIFLCVTLILNSHSQGPLFLMGVNYVYDMQAYSSPILNFIQNMFTQLGESLTMIGIYIGLSQLVIVYKRKILVLVHIICILGGVFLMQIFKQIYKEPRPFWINSQIHNLGWTCASDFGNPSGHSFFMLALYEPILSDIVGTGKKRVLLAVLLIIAVIVMTSRMYLAAHSLNQVVFGAFLGSFYLVIYHYKLQQFVYELISNILNQKHKLVYFICNTIACVSFMVISIILYQSDIEDQPIEQIWMDNITCKSHNQQIIIFIMLKKTFYCFGAVGIIYGCLLLSNKENKDTLYMVGLWNFKDWKSRILYYVAFVVVAIPSVIFYFLVPALISSNIVSYFFISLSILWGGFCLSFVLPAILNKFDLITFSLNASPE